LYNPFYKKIQEASRKLAPGLTGQAEVSWDHLISPLEIKLPRKVLDGARSAIEAFYRVSRLPAYAQKLQPAPAVCAKAPPNRSVLMAYDFHTTEDGDCYLVEINTNASGFMLASLMNVAHTDQKIEEFKPLQDLFASFRNELSLFNGGPVPAVPNVAIVDENLLEQKMYPEFVMYQDWFRTHGWKAELMEAADFRAADLVYNRTTDFYFDDETLGHLRRAYENKDACFSPNPYEYWLLADKERLIQFGTDSFWEGLGAAESDQSAIQKVLIPTFDSKTFGSPEEIWEQRKSLFFKPKRSHGGKSVYRGESVSRKVFERLMMEDILIQKYLPAQRVPVDSEYSVLANWKFDLRFFAYEDKIQLCAARIYQGQVTNFASPFGGFTFVQF
jgi:hypothetical protein